MNVFLPLFIILFIDALYTIFLFKMKEQKRKLSWFQKVILGYMVLLGFLNGLMPAVSKGNLFGGIGQGFGSGFAFLLIVLFFTWLYNKYISPKINVQSKTLKKSWQVIQIIVICLIMLWLILFFFGIFFVK